MMTHLTDVEIRRAKFDDLDTLMQMRMELINADRLLSFSDSDELAEACWQYYREALENGSHIACIAYRGGRPVACGGMCLHSEMPSGGNPSGRCACLMNIHVYGDKRYALGRDIVCWLVEEARALGVTKIYLETGIAERYMYHSMGFRGMDDMMILSAPAV